jgi:hypothetical protein
VIADAIGISALAVQQRRIRRLENLQVLQANVACLLKVDQAITRSWSPSRWKGSRSSPLWALGRVSVQEAANGIFDR